MGFMMFVIEIIWLGNHLNGGAKYLAYVTQMPDVTCKIITVLGFGIYVFIGGYMAVVTTDAVQFIAILIGFLTIAFRAIPMAGGYQNVVDTFTAVGKPGAMTFYGLGSYGVMAAIALVLSTAMGVIGTPPTVPVSTPPRTKRPLARPSWDRASCCSAGALLPPSSA